MKRKLWACCITLAGFALPNYSAAQQFQPAAYFVVAPANSALWAAVTADFNHDGKFDLAITDNATGHVSILLGDGDGTFRRGNGFPSLGALGLATGDLNGDGNADLVVSNTLNKINVAFGNGDGTFQRSVPYPAGVGPVGMVVTDLDGDGHPDVAVANSNESAGHGGSVWVYLNQGNGTLSPQVKYTMSGHPWSLTAADLNGDGQLDLAVVKNNYTGGSGFDTLSILLNIGNGAFLNTANYSVGVEVASVAAGDLDNDGNLDLALAADQHAVVMLGNGAGTFGSATSYSTASLGQAASAVVIADFNLDGKLDLAVGLANGIPTADSGLFYGNGNGTFQTPPLAINTNVNGGSSLVTGDFNQDGACDLAMPIGLKGKVAVMINTQ